MLSNMHDDHQHSSASTPNNNNNNNNNTTISSTSSYPNLMLNCFPHHDHEQQQHLLISSNNHPHSSWSHFLLRGGGLSTEEQEFEGATKRRRIDEAKEEEQDDESDHQQQQLYFTNNTNFQSFLHPPSVLPNIIKPQVFLLNTQNPPSTILPPSFSPSSPMRSSSSCSNWSTSTNIITASSHNAKFMLDFSSHDHNTILDPHRDPSISSECNSTGKTIGGVVSNNYNKKARVHQKASSSSQPFLKVRKEKLGDRITALHQIVSPFGKTDTASVLLEAIGYIRFLQTQIQALTSPYLARTNNAAAASPFSHSSNITPQQHSIQDCEEVKPLIRDLRSRGLCLVPVTYTQHVGGNEIVGADYWAPTIGGGF